MNCSFHATSNNYISPASADHFHCIANSFGSRGAGAYWSVNPSSRLQFQPYICSWTVRHQHRNGMWTYRARTLFAQDVILIEHGDDTADTRGNNNAEAFLINIGGASICPRFTRRDQTKLF